MNASLINQNNRYYFRKFIVIKRIELAIILVLLITAAVLCISSATHP